MPSADVLKAKLFSFVMSSEVETSLAKVWYGDSVNRPHLRMRTSSGFAQSDRESLVDYAATQFLND